MKDTSNRPASDEHSDQRVKQYGLGPVGGQRPPFAPPAPSNKDKNQPPKSDTKTGSDNTKKE